MLDSSFIIHFLEHETPRVTKYNTGHKFIDILVLGFIANLFGYDD